MPSTATSGPLRSTAAAPVGRPPEGVASSGPPPSGGSRYALRPAAAPWPRAAGSSRGLRAGRRGGPGARAQADVGQRGRGQGSAVVPDDLAVAALAGAVGVPGAAAVRALVPRDDELGLPVRAGARDVVVRAAHEVPPHDDVLAERLAPHEHRPRGGVRPRLDDERRAAGLDVPQRRRRHGRALQPHDALVDEEAVLERRVHVERDACAGRQIELRPDDRRVRRGGRAQGGAAHAERAEEDLHARAVDRGDGEVGVVLERGRVREAVARERDPELDAVQDRGALAARRLLRVRDAAARGHEVELAGPHRLERPDGVAVQDLPREQPRDRLEPGVGVRRHLHAVGAVADRGQRVGPVVVEEAPCADERPRTLRDRAPHPHRPGAPERDVAVLEDLDRGASAVVVGRARRADALLGPGLEVAHGTSVGARGGAVLRLSTVFASGRARGRMGTRPLGAGFRGASPCPRDPGAVGPGGPSGRRSRRGGPAPSRPPGCPGRCGDADRGRPSGSGRNLRRRAQPRSRGWRVVHRSPVGRALACAARRRAVLARPSDPCVMRAGTPSSVCARPGRYGRL